MDKDLMGRVRELEEEKKYQEAEAILFDLMAEDPGNTSYKRQLANLRLKEGRFREAELLIDEVLGQTPQDPYALQLKGNIALKRNRNADAFKYFEAAYKVKPNPYYASQMVEAKLRMGTPEEALEVARSFVREYPKDKWLRWKLGRAEELCGNKEEALKIYEELRKDEEGDDRLLASIMRLKAEISERGSAGDLERILKLDKYKENVEMLISTAQMHFKGGEYRKAAEYYERAHKLAPENQYIIEQLGYCYNRLHEDELAARYLKMAMENDPMNFYVRRAITSVYKRLGREEELIEFLNELLVKYPDFKEAYGLIKQLSGDGKGKKRKAEVKVNTFNTLKKDKSEGGKVVK